jgi:hypothetical protein
LHAIGYSAAIIGVLAVTGCAVAPPTGPDVAVMPAKGKTLEAFQADDTACRQYASAQIGNGSPAEAANRSAVGSTVLGTALGAAAGAAIGAAAGNPAAGAAIGAGSGFVLGGATGLSTAQASGYALQQRYDIAYLQCMSAKGENVPTASVSAVATYPGYPYPYWPYWPYYDPYYPAYFVSPFLGFGFGLGFFPHRPFPHHAFLHFHQFQHFRRF